MKRKKLIGVLLALALAVTLAACADGGNDPTGEPTGDPAGASTGDPTGATAPPDYTSFSEGLDDNGFFTGVKAAECVTLPAFEDVAMPEFPKITSGRAIADKDFVNIDYVGSIDGVEFEGGSTGGEGSDIVVGYTSFIDDFIEQLKGHEPGETFDIEVTFPDDYGSEDLQGKDAVFKITVNYIWDVSEEAAKAIGFESREKMAQYVAGNYAAVEDVVSDMELNVFAAAAEVGEIPDSVLSTVRALISASVEAEANSYGLDINTYLSYLYGVSSMDELLDAQTRPTAEMYVILQAVAEREGIRVTDADIAEEGLDEYVDIFGKPYMAFSLLQKEVSELITEKLS